MSQIKQTAQRQADLLRKTNKKRKIFQEIYGFSLSISVFFGFPRIFCVFCWDKQEKALDWRETVEEIADSGFKAEIFTVNSQ